MFNEFMLISFNSYRFCINFTINITNPPLITFSIPLYNKISYLERLVLSILQYTNTIRNKNYILFEMVVVDSNSNDGSYQFFVDLSTILSLPYNMSSPIFQPNFLDKYHIKQFIINSKNYKNFSSFKKVPFSNVSILNYDRSCLHLKVIRKNSKTLSNIARQIAVENSCGKYIWQVDPDDLINTTFLPTIINQIYNFNKIDIIEFGYILFVMKNGFVCRSHINPNKNLHLTSNYDIVKRFLTKYVNWELWHCLVRREIYLQAIETIKTLVPDQEKISLGSDLFHYIPIIFHSNSCVSVSGVGYLYFFLNNGSVSLGNRKNKIKFKKNGLIIYKFLCLLFNYTGIPFRKNLKNIKTLI